MPITSERETAGRAWTPGPLTYDRYTGDIVMDDELGARVATIDLDNCANKDQAHADGRLFAAAPELFEALSDVRKLIAEAALTGFNWKDGSWAARLFASQQRTSAALSRATATGEVK